MIINEQLECLKIQFNIIDVINCDDYIVHIEELYSRIKKNQLNEYHNNDRLVFLITSDSYKKNKPAGVMLESLQIILNDLDIPNFFTCLITSNTNIQLEYNWILNNVSTDKKAIHIYECKGDYSRFNFTNQGSYIKYQKIENINLIDSLSEKQKNLIFHDNSFCLMPWIGLMIQTTGDVKPCCESSEILGNCSKNSIENIWNSNASKRLRKDFLEGKKPPTCSKCYTAESLGRDSLRKSINRTFAKYISKINKTQGDGFLEDFSLNFVDSRFSNLCNLSCRMCGPTASTSWYQPAISIGLIDKSSKSLKTLEKNNYSIYDQIIKHLDTIDRIYFAGGEPTMIEEFYHIVEELDRRNRHDVELIYTINMTRSSLNGKSIFDVWKNFKKIVVAASLDGEYQRGEYIRAGQSWNDVVKFRKELLDKRSDIDFYITATTSIINALHLPDFHRSWVDKGLIKPSEFNIHMLYAPEYLRVDSAPKYLKDLIREK